VAQSEGIDIAALIQQVAPPANPDDANDTAPAMLQGTASFDGPISGKGTTLDDAIAASEFLGPVSVRSPVLNGINLGFAATHPGATVNAGGGSTRFISMEAIAEARGSDVTIRDIRAHAGALAAFGQISVSPDHKLSGLLHVDLGKTRVLAPIRVAVHGTVAKPEFGR
jgi:hypothetical protein